METNSPRTTATYFYECVPLLLAWIELPHAPSQTRSRHQSSYCTQAQPFLLASSSQFSSIGRASVMPSWNDNLHPIGHHLPPCLTGARFAPSRHFPQSSHLRDPELYLRGPIHSRSSSFRVWIGAARFSIHQQLLFPTSSFLFPRCPSCPVSPRPLC